MEKYLTIDELCHILRVKKHYVYALTSQGLIPYTKVGRFLRFSQSEIQDWLNQRSHTVENTEPLKELLE